MMNQVKRMLSLFGVLLLCGVLCSCRARDAKSVESYRWSLEMLSNADGEVLYHGTEFDDTDADGVDVLDLTLRFDGGEFLLSDHTHQQEWKGTYTSEEAPAPEENHETSRLELTFETSETPVEGVFGTRVYSDQTTKVTITLGTDDYILSFVGEEI